MSSASSLPSAPSASPKPGSRQSRLHQLYELLSRDEDWLVLINADPDAMASALAFKRLLAHRAGEVTIARINDIRRPDNLAMVRYLHLPMIRWDDSLCGLFHRFALVDSQPHHSPHFAGVPFSVVIDHHPLVAQSPVHASFVDVRPNMGATSTIMTEYLRAQEIRPGALLATALQYGIRTDTASFTRHATEHDLRAYLHLSRYADSNLLLRIMRSEYLPEWLPYFSRAFSSLHVCRAHGKRCNTTASGSGIPGGNAGGYAFLDVVENPDILVVVADFFTRVHGFGWVAVCGVYQDTVVVIFRGDGKTDLGKFSADKLGDLGSAGGHRTMARAEFPLAATEGRNVEVFVFRRLAPGG